MGKAKVILAGALPPPHIGPTLANEIILNSSLRDAFDVVHLDTSVNADFASLGRFSLRSLLLGIKSYFSLIGLIRKERPELLYLQTTQSTLAYIKDSIYVLIGSAMGVRVVGHLRGSEFKSWRMGQGPLMQRYILYVQKRLSRQLVLGQCLISLYTDVMPRERIAVVANGKNLPELKLDSSKHEKPGPLNVLFLSNLRSRKGALETLEAFRLLCESTELPLRLVLAGAPRDSDVVEGIEAFLSVNNSLDISLPGQVMAAQKNELLAEADIFVFPPTEPEGHPWVLVEALAAGLPVVATDQGAIVESVHHEKNGFITNGAPDDIASCLEKLVLDSALRKAFASQSRLLYESEFTEQSMVSNLKLVFEDCLADTD